MGRGMMWARGRRGNVRTYRSNVGSSVHSCNEPKHTYVAVATNRRIVAMYNIPASSMKVCTVDTFWMRWPKRLGDGGVASETRSLDSQSRASVSAKQFAYVLRVIHQLGLLELKAQPWCYGERVKLSACNTADDDRDESLTGVVQWPDDCILYDWAKNAAKYHSWEHDKGWSPTNSLAVLWSDRKLKYYKADCHEGLHDLAVVVPSAGWAPTRMWSFAGLFQVFADVQGLAGTDMSSVQRRQLYLDMLNHSMSTNSKWKFWKERMDRYATITSFMASKQVYSSLNNRVRQRKRVKFLVFAKADFVYFCIAGAHAPEWWEFRALLS